MKCKNCGKEFVSFFSDLCPFCGVDNSKTESLLDSILFPSTSECKSEREIVDPYDMDNPDNYSDYEYMDDDDYDDFDN